MDEIQIEKVDLLKIDTEGHEFEVIKGIKEKIKNIKFSILVEFHNDVNLCFLQA